MVLEKKDADNGSTLPTRTKKTRQSRKKLKKLNKRSVAAGCNPLSESEIAQHVSSQYVLGSGGYLKVIEKRWSRMEAMSSIHTSNSDLSHKDHVTYLKKLDQYPALVLNADYQPLSVLPLSLWSWQESVKSVFSGKVTVVDVYPDVFVRAVNIHVPLPSVIALLDYVPQKHQRPAFTRRNVFLRDGYRCQYCAECFRTEYLSLDHVVPRCMGGKLEWENTVTSCRKCNGLKGSVLPGDLRGVGMKLLREPRVPSKYELASEAEKMLPKTVHSTWAPFLGFQITPPASGKSCGLSEDAGVGTLFKDVQSQ